MISPSEFLKWLLVFNVTHGAPTPPGPYLPIAGGTMTGNLHLASGVDLFLDGFPPNVLLGIPDGGTVVTYYALPLALVNGGTNNTLTAVNGGIAYSDASKLNLSAAPTASKQLLLAGPSSAPVWSTLTFPDTSTASTILASFANNTVKNATLVAGTGISINYSDPNITITATTGGVTSAKGTANQILINGSTSIQTGDLIFTTPQDIATTSNVQFNALGLGVAPSTTAGQIQTTGISKFGSNGAFTSVASHEFVWVSGTGRFINIYLTGTISQVSAGGAQVGLEIQNTFNYNAGTWATADAVWVNPTFTMAANLPQACGFRSTPTLSSGSGFTLTSLANFRSSTASTGGFAGTLGSFYGFYGEALNVGTNRYGSYILAPTGGTIAIASYTDNLSVGFNLTPPANGALISGITGLGTSAIVTDMALPAQINATSSNERYFAANKAGAYGALFGFINGTGLGTGAVIRCVTADPIYMYVNSTTPAMYVNSSAQVAFNTVSVSSNFRYTFNMSTTDLVGMNLQGSLVPTSGTPVALRIINSLSPASAADSAYLVQLVPTFAIPASGGNWAGATYTASTLTLTGNLSQYFGARYDAPIKTGSGTCTYAWQIYAERPTFATNNYTAYFARAVGIGTNTPINYLDIAGGVAIGSSYAGIITAPADGVAIQGQSLFKGTSSFIGASVEVQGSDRISFGLGGTKTSTDNVTQAGMYFGATYAPTASTTIVAQLLSYPQFNPPTGVTIATAYNLRLSSGGQAGLGSITTGINLYVENPGFGTNKIAAAINGATTIGTTTVDTGYNLTVSGGVSTDTLKISTGAVINYVWRCTGASGTGAWSVDANNSGVWNQNYVHVTSSTYSITSTNCVIGVDTTSNTVTLQLPVGNPGDVLLIQDEGGFATTNNIFINSPIPGHINGVLTFTLAFNYSGAILHCRGNVSGVNEWYGGAINV